MKRIRIIPSKDPLNGEVVIPGSKSYTNRALLLAAMTPGCVRIVDPLISDDTEAMIGCLRTLGIEVVVNQDCIDVSGDVREIADRPYLLNANLSGTTIRFMLALSSAIPGIKTLYGGEGLNKRPIGDLVDGLRQLGAEIEYLVAEGHPPLRVTSSSARAGTVRMNGAVSSQYLSALLMVAPLIGEVVVEVVGEQISRPYVDMTIDTMARFGVQVGNEGYRRLIVAGGQHYATERFVVEADFSSASYFLALAALTGSTLTLKNLNLNSAQADVQFLRILEAMGNEVNRDGDDVTVRGKAIKAMHVDMENCPDQAQTMAVLSAFAPGVTTITGVRSLRVKETERVVAVENELSKMGIRTSSTIDTLTIFGGDPKPASIDTYGDHRMAMAFAVAGAKLRNMEICDPDVVTKTFPRFWDALHSIGIETELTDDSLSFADNIILIGMRGSGKTTTGRVLAQRMGRELLETDEMVVQKAGMSIPALVSQDGWECFRQLESEVVTQVCKLSGKVISTGGGVVVNEENVRHLKMGGVIVLLEAQPAILLSRMGDDENRPALTDKLTRQEEIVQVLIERERLYKSAADVVVTTDNLSPEAIAEVIMQRVRDRLSGRNLRTSSKRESVF